ncbi:unnamed protein product [Amoebophrya sp. A120]|nr:unnamed protein product [Amoebophrya sp. A120]|eukprot:GSA120T00001470001.1
MATTKKKFTTAALPQDALLVEQEVERSVETPPPAPEIPPIKIDFHRAGLGKLFGATGGPAAAAAANSTSAKDTTATSSTAVDEDVHQTTKDKHSEDDGDSTARPPHSATSSASTSSGKASSISANIETERENSAAAPAPGVNTETKNLDVDYINQNVDSKDSWSSKSSPHEEVATITISDESIKNLSASVEERQQQEHEKKVAALEFNNFSTMNPSVRANILNDLDAKKISSVKRLMRQLLEAAERTAAKNEEQKNAKNSKPRQKDQADKHDTTSLSTAEVTSFAKFFGGLDAGCLRFLRVAHFDIEKSRERIVAATRWRTHTIEKDFAGVRNILRNNPRFQKLFFPCVGSAIVSAKNPLPPVDLENNEILCGYDGSPVELWRLCNVDFDTIFSEYTDKEVELAYITYCLTKEETCRRTRSKSIISLVDAKDGPSLASMLFKHMATIHRYTHWMAAYGKEYFPDSVTKVILYNAPPGAEWLFNMFKGLTVSDVAREQVVILSAGIPESSNHYWPAPRRDRTTRTSTGSTTSTTSASDGTKNSSVKSGADFTDSRKTSTTAQPPASRESSSRTTRISISVATSNKNIDTRALEEIQKVLDYDQVVPELYRRLPVVKDKDKKVKA